MSVQKPRAAEFFAGIGLVRKALEHAGFEVVWANDIEPTKAEMYSANFPGSHLVLGDVLDPEVVDGRNIPDIELATASFPCTDLSLAGNRVGLGGSQSGAFWGFLRALWEMGPRRPKAVLLENVPSLASSHGGKDLRVLLSELNGLGYVIDMLVVDARHFVPQSRPRLFIIGSLDEVSGHAAWEASELRPQWMRDLLLSHPEIRTRALPLRLPPRAVTSLEDVLERLTPYDDRWWDGERVGRFLASLSPLQAERVRHISGSLFPTWATAYRRTREGRATWEVRSDHISGCLRTARGGSSKQAVLESGGGNLRIRWMTGLEYARLQGAPDYDISRFRENQVIFGFGDAVCVPAVAWLAEQYLYPLLTAETSTSQTRVAYA